MTIERVVTFAVVMLLLVVDCSGPIYNLTGTFFPAPRDTPSPIRQSQ